MKQLHPAGRFEPIISYPGRFANGQDAEADKRPAPFIRPQPEPAHAPAHAPVPRPAPPPALPPRQLLPSQAEDDDEYISPWERISARRLADCHAAVNPHADDPADRPLLTTWFPELQTAFERWQSTRPSALDAVRRARRSIERRAARSEPQYEQAFVVIEPRPTSAARAYEGTWREETNWPYLHLTPEQELVSDLRRDHDEDFCTDDYWLTCWACGTPTFSKNRWRDYDVCTTCYRFLVRHVVDFDGVPGNADDKNSDSTDSYDVELVRRAPTGNGRPLLPEEIIPDEQIEEWISILRNTNPVTRQ